MHYLSDRCPYNFHDHFSLFTKPERLLLSISSQEFFLVPCAACVDTITSRIASELPVAWNLLELLCGSYYLSFIIDLI